MTELRTKPPEVYKNDAGQWRCVDCSMWGGRESYPAKCCGDMLEHLRQHQQVGEPLPEAEVNALLLEFWWWTWHEKVRPEGTGRL
jgi:hypothetical protein